ncbi:SMI1/KNR4 family protein [Spirillospora sp. NPDC048823]|uniref:SMI1/KNR4 family protein n=1 Tax=unclassified Spirillospora TaxID=2642701 RepID=UPI003714E098
MDHEELFKAASHLTGADRPAGLVCDEPGHPGGHTCLPVSAGVDADDLVKAFTGRFSAPRTRSHGLPPLPVAEQNEWTHAWTWASRAIALGRGANGRPVLAVTERNMPGPDELPADMPWVDRLAAITGGPSSPPPPPDWAAVESRLGTPLPSDYRRLVEVFGCDGRFDVFFRVCDPDELIDRWQDYAGDDPAAGGLPGFPLPGGLIPWSDNEHHETFFWITDGPDPDRWPVYAVNETDEGTRFECTATEFLFRQMTDPECPFYSAAEYFTGHWFMQFIRPAS